MFSFLDASGALAIRLSPSERDAFIAAFDTSLHEAHGRVMREYVTVPANLPGDPARLRRWFQKSVAHARTLKAKSTTRR